MFWMGYPSVTMSKGSSKPMQGPSPQGFVNLILMAQFNVFKRWLKGQICKILRDNILFFFKKKLVSDQSTS